MIIRDQDRIGLYAVGALVLLAVAMCLSALFSKPTPRIGGHHAAAWEKPRGAKYALSQDIASDLDSVRWGSIPQRALTARCGA